MEELAALAALGFAVIGALIWIGLALLRDAQDDVLAHISRDRPRDCICCEHNPECICEDARECGRDGGAER
ncbi:MAG: hypothetical protein ACOY6K_12550 [Pseudomonadota bacterium]